MRIRWTQLAVNDLTGISDYIAAKDGPESARRVALAIFERIEELESFPRQGRFRAVKLKPASWSLRVCRTLWFTDYEAMRSK
jgi:plasmid stabilization system protein ParE